MPGGNTDGGKGGTSVNGEKTSPVVAFAKDSGEQDSREIDCLVRVLLGRSGDGEAINDNDGFCLSARASKVLSTSAVFKGGFSIGS